MKILPHVKQILAIISLKNKHSRANSNHLRRFEASPKFMCTCCRFPFANHLFWKLFLKAESAASLPYVCVKIQISKILK